MIRHYSRHYNTGEKEAPGVLELERYLSYRRWASRTVGVQEGTAAEDRDGWIGICFTG